MAFVSRYRNLVSFANYLRPDVQMTIGQNIGGNSPLCSAAWFDIAGATHYTVAVLSSTLSHSLEMEKGEELSISGLEHTFPIEYRAKESSCCSGKY